ncbi:rhamnan synthesis F family protein [Marinovum sp.]|uniref:rhamnan synthesis F family protein n=1 Tax=Marinovum sp. TaxID=2024839 RepID=UPI003A9496B3
MLQIFRRKASTVLRYLFPTAADRHYLARIQSSGLFDRDFYLRSNARLKWLFRIWPERHYVQLGERNGTCPNPGFSPRAYLFHNPDLAGETRPFLHYIETGRAERRMVLAAPSSEGVPVFPDIAPPDPAAGTAPVAVALHLYYPEFWEEIAPALEAQQFAFDLHVTITRRGDLPPGAGAALETRIRAAFPAARIWQMPNHGRDILPFAHLVNAGGLAPYRAVLKLHSKKSPHRADGDAWRRALVAGVLGDPAETAARLERFLAHPRAGIWVADGHLHEGDSWWGGNRPRAEALLARSGAALPPGPLCFPAGSIYWARAAVLAKLARLRLTPEDFEPEQALVEGTTAHAVERLMGALTIAAGRVPCTSRTLDRPGALPPGLDTAGKIGH